MISTSKSTENLVAEVKESTTQHENNIQESQDTTATTSEEPPTENVDFKVIYNKQKISVNFPIDGTVADLKTHLQKIISVPQAMQKVMFKGLAKDDQTLRNLGVAKGKDQLNRISLKILPRSFLRATVVCKQSIIYFYLVKLSLSLYDIEGAKVMIVGSKLDDVLAVSIPTKQELNDEAVSSASKEPLSQQKIHRKVLDKGIPEDVMPGILDSKVLQLAQSQFYTLYDKRDVGL